MAVGQPPRCLHAHLRVGGGQCEHVRCDSPCGASSCRQAPARPHNNATQCGTAGRGSPTLTRSVGEATEMPMAPVVSPAAILMPSPGSPTWSLPTCRLIAAGAAGGAAGGRRAGWEVRGQERSGGCAAPSGPQQQQQQQQQPHRPAAPQQPPSSPPWHYGWVHRGRCAGRRTRPGAAGLHSRHSMGGVRGAREHTQGCAVQQRHAGRRRTWGQALPQRGGTLLARHRHACAQQAPARSSGAASHESMPHCRLRSPTAESLHPAMPCPAPALTCTWARRSWAAAAA